MVASFVHTRTASCPAHVDKFERTACMLELMGPVNRRTDGGCMLERYPTPLVTWQVFGRREGSTLLTDDVWDGIAWGTLLEGARPD